MDDTVKIFVYGTLKEHGFYFYNPRLIDNRIRVEKDAYILGYLFDFGPFPGVKLSKKETNKVFGECHTFINPKIVLATMDSIEGPLYKRKETLVFTNENKSTAYVYEASKYLYTRLQPKLIRSGIYNIRRENHASNSTTTES